MNCARLWLVSKSCCFEFKNDMKLKLIPPDLIMS